jgi:Uma2 family endonuclease
MATESTTPKGLSRATQRLLLRDVPWHSYESLLDSLRLQPIRITYDSGRLEFLALSDEHRTYARLVARLIGYLAQAQNTRLIGGKPTTFKRRAASRGLEPDKFFYFGDELPGRGMREILTDIDRPPDLAVQIDLEGSDLDRPGIYAAVDFPEVWRDDGSELRVHRLRDGKLDTESKRSPSLPFPPLNEAFRLLWESETMDDSALVPSLSGWIRQEMDRELRSRVIDGIEPDADVAPKAAAQVDLPVAHDPGAARPHENEGKDTARRTHSKGSGS